MPACSSPDAGRSADLVGRLLDRCTFPPAGSRVTCAVSGGADSSALLVLAVAAGCVVDAVHGTWPQDRPLLVRFSATDWVEGGLTVILGGLAIGLLNFGDKIGKISAGLFTLVAMMAMIYALFTFHWRARSIRLRGQGGFDDRLGPTILTIALFAAVIVNFVLRLTMGGEQHHGKN